MGENPITIAITLPVRHNVLFIITRKEKFTE